MRKSESLNPETGAAEEARPREEANEATSDWRFAMSSGFRRDFFAFAMAMVLD